MPSPPAGPRARRGSRVGSVARAVFRNGMHGLAPSTPLVVSPKRWGNEPCRVFPHLVPPRESPGTMVGRGIRLDSSLGAPRISLIYLEIRPFLEVRSHASGGKSQNRAGNGLFAHPLGLTLMGISLSSSFYPKRTGNRPRRGADRKCGRDRSLKTRARCRDVHRPDPKMRAIR